MLAALCEAATWARREKREGRRREGCFGGVVARLPVLKAALADSRPSAEQPWRRPPVPARTKEDLGLLEAQAQQLRRTIARRKTVEGAGGARRRRELGRDAQVGAVSLLRDAALRSQFTARGRLRVKFGFCVMAEAAAAGRGGARAAIFCGAAGPRRRLPRGRRAAPAAYGGCGRPYLELCARLWVARPMVTAAQTGGEHREKALDQLFSRKGRGRAYADTHFAGHLLAADRAEHFVRAFDAASRRLQRARGRATDVRLLAATVALLRAARSGCARFPRAPERASPLRARLAAPPAAPLLPRPGAGALGFCPPPRRAPRGAAAAPPRLFASPGRQSFSPPRPPPSPRRAPCCGGAAAPDGAAAAPRRLARAAARTRPREMGAPGCGRARAAPGGRAGGGAVDAEPFGGARAAPGGGEDVTARAQENPGDHVKGPELRGARAR
ncbi:unnamed protein product [Prorocentrum cordatum]|uniref:Uncharacterized protein n=1 Tax=Prorocentrum cordatum TaxID=2364126 RepID=A0ABN9VI17_9DINO|nr:unnamed protein product [Polarella glacialis]